MASYWWDVNGVTTGLGGQGTWDKTGTSANTWSKVGPPGNTTTSLWVDGNQAILTGSVASPPRATVRNNNMSASSIEFQGALGTTFTINYNNGSLTTGYMSYVQSTLSVAVPLYGISKIQSNAGSAAVFIFSSYFMSSSTGLNLVALNPGVSNIVRFINGSTNFFGGPITVENGVVLSLQSVYGCGGTYIDLKSASKIVMTTSFTGGGTFPRIVQAPGTTITASNTISQDNIWPNPITCSGDVTNTNESNYDFSINGLEITGTMTLRGAATGATYTIAGPVTGSRLHMTSTVGNQRITLNNTNNLLTASCQNSYFKVNNQSTFQNFLCQTNGTFELNGGYLQTIPIFQLTGSGVTAADGVIKNISGNNSISGTLIFANAATANSQAGTLSLSGTINTNSFPINLSGSGNFGISADITGNGSLTINSASRINKQNVNCVANLTFNNNTINFGS